jgi:hypothetical protein
VSDQENVCQRWRNGRARYRPAGEVFDHSHAAVEEIDETTAKAFVIGHHYARSYPAARFRAGLFLQPPHQRERLVGVAVFSVPMNQRVVPKYLECAPNDGVELGRFVLLDEIAANAETWFLARAFRRLRTRLGSHGVIAYSDPSERCNIHGETVKRGHIGTIYKAHNARYRGRASARTLLLAPNGVVVCDRTLSKIRGDERGRDYALAQLLALGAPPRQRFESGHDYAIRLRADFLRPLPHPGNHTFTWKFA